MRQTRAAEGLIAQVRVALPALEMPSSSSFALVRFAWELEPRRFGWLHRFFSSRVEKDAQRREQEFTSLVDSVEEALQAVASMGSAIQRTEADWALLRPQIVGAGSERLDRDVAELKRQFRAMGGRRDVRDAFERRDGNPRTTVETHLTEIKRRLDALDGLLDAVSLAVRERASSLELERKLHAELEVDCPPMYARLRSGAESAVREGQFDLAAKRWRVFRSELERLDERWQRTRGLLAQTQSTFDSRTRPLDLHTTEIAEANSIARAIEGLKRAPTPRYTEAVHEMRDRVVKYLRKLDRIEWERDFRMILARDIRRWASSQRDAPVQQKDGGPRSRGIAARAEQTATNLADVRRLPITDWATTARVSIELLEASTTS